MKSKLRVSLSFVAVLALPGLNGVALAAPPDGGLRLDASTRDGATSDGSSELPPSDLACGGALCQTAPGATTCDVSRGLGARSAALPISVLLFITAIAAGALLRRARAKDQAR